MEAKKTLILKINNWWIDKQFFGKHKLSIKYYNRGFAGLTQKQINHIYLKENLSMLL